MHQSLPNIVGISTVPCSELPPNITEKFMAGIPIGVFPIPTAIEHYGTAKCEAEQEYVNGGYSEKTVLQFSSTAEIKQFPHLAFVIKDAQGATFLIGTREAPHPMVEITATIDKETNIKAYKVSFTRRKSLIPCSV